MPKLSESKLEKLTHDVQGWNEIMQRNAERLNDILLYISQSGGALLDCNAPTPSNNDALVWDTGTSKWINVPWGSVIPTTTTTTTTFTTTSTTTVTYTTTSTTTSTTVTGTGTTTTSTTTTTTSDLEQYGCVWNPEDKHSYIDLSNGNLTATANTTHWDSVRATKFVSSGKWYWEVTVNVAATASNMIGIMTSSANLGSYVGNDQYGWGYNGQDGDTFHNAVSPAYGNTFTANDVIGVAVDLDNGKIFFSKNGTWQNSGDPVAGTGFAWDNVSGSICPACSPYTSTNAMTANFGQSEFSDPPPSGYSGLCGSGTTTSTTSTTSTTTTTTTSTTTTTTTGFPEAWNPSDKGSNITLNNGNRDALKGGGAGWSGASVRGTTGKSSGKWYWECIPVVDGGDHMVGVGNTSASLDSYVGSDTNGWGNYGNGTTYYNGSSTGSFPTYGQGDIVMVAIDMDNGKVWWGVNGTWSGDPAAGTGERYSGLSGTIYPMSSLYTDADEQRILANDTEMNYSPPNGFTTLDGDKIGTTTTTT